MGIVPAAGELNLDGLELPQQNYEQLFAVDKESWLQECEMTEEFYAKFGGRVPAGLSAQLQGLRERLSK